MAKAKKTQAIQAESKVAFTRTEMAEMVANMPLEERLALFSETTTKDERKSLNQAETARVAREKREKDERERQASRDSEEATIRKASEAELATLKPKYHTTAKRITEFFWSVEKNDWDETSRWDFGKVRASRSGASINKRTIDQERVIFPKGTRIVIGNTDYAYSTKACDSLNIDYTNDSASRALCNESILKQDSLGVKIRVTTPAGTTETDLLKYATSERVTVALATRE